MRHPPLFGCMVKKARTILSLLSYRLGKLARHQELVGARISLPQAHFSSDVLLCESMRRIRYNSQSGAAIYLLPEDILEHWLEYPKDMPVLTREDFLRKSLKDPNPARQRSAVDPSYFLF
ncbi:hypothetical protein JCGZ_19152 [Jatropha curcas]|uniref:Uncharacterized protein n=1 Tax=Jatropha curcas TaxID=180498 RepID=A0A067KCC0_JATCU|nr:hypothetical protein JCGZ_19152 [Jatropha curcas]